MTEVTVFLSDEVRSDLRQIRSMAEYSSEDSYSELIAELVEERVTELEEHQEAIEEKQAELSEKISGSSPDDSDSSSASLAESDEVREEQGKLADKLF